MKAQIQELEKYLSSIGFEGDELINSITDCIHNGSPQFSVEHHIVRKNEVMKYQLRFETDQQFNKYRLIGYDASYYLLTTDGSDIPSESHQKSKTFHATVNGICNSNLAYYILSGKLERLHMLITQSGVGNYPAFDLYSFLAHQLSENPESFLIKCSENEREGFIDFEIPVTIKDGEIQISDYEVTFTPHQPIKHGRYSGIDTRDLLREMESIPWHDDASLYKLTDDDTPEFTSLVQPIYDKVMSLREHPEGKIVSDRLQLKFWCYTSLLDSFIEESAWDLLAKSEKRMTRLSIEISSWSALNLMCGRSTMAPNHKQKFMDNTWMKLDFSRKDRKGNHPILKSEGPTAYELDVMLDMLPLDDKYNVKTELMQGGQPTVILTTPQGKNSYSLVAVPDQKNIQLFDASGNPIPYNFKLEKGFSPVEFQQKMELKSSKKHIPKNRQGRKL